MIHRESSGVAETHGRPAASGISTRQGGMCFWRWPDLVSLLLEHESTKQGLRGRTNSWCHGAFRGRKIRGGTSSSMRTRATRDAHRCIGGGIFALTQGPSLVEGLGRVRQWKSGPCASTRCDLVATGNNGRRSSWSAKGNIVGCPSPRSACQGAFLEPRHLSSGWPQTRAFPVCLVESTGFFPPHSGIKTVHTFRGNRICAGGETRASWKRRQPSR